MVTGGAGGASPDPSEALVQTSGDDPRCGRIGASLRKFCCDRDEGPDGPSAADPVQTRCHLFETNLQILRRDPRRYGYHPVVGAFPLKCDLRYRIVTGGA
ncbi:hypothetical protein GCM10023349_30950 [Nocardioides conyzicola]|uniref:Uncharacterized protein n=1 Tax=Nocardioides conyzicola TaxID=1651781 RepID=A0ABP8XMF6_9ACTN